ncbi:MAG TPA: toast rack family protein [Terriglobales bacterium]|nr:toast rack family protein [Terriglobales bacterium]
MPYRRNSIVGALILIVIGGLFLYSNMHPSFDPWGIVARYWPLLLIFIGIDKLWDYQRYRKNPEAAGGRWFTGGEIAFIILLLIFFGGLSIGGIGHNRRQQHQWAQTVDLQGAKLVHVSLDMPAGNLQLDSNGSKLLEADFNYQSPMPRPDITYNVTGTDGELRVSQQEHQPHIQIGPTRNTWDLHFAHDVPMEMRVNMGAGRNDLKLGGLDLTRLDVNMGAGLLIADFSGGTWKQDLEANIHGGAGNATVRLPANVGVEVRAKGGLGSVQAFGLTKEGDEYVNTQFGKSPVTLHINVEGGVGLIRLEQVS